MFIFVDTRLRTSAYPHFMTDDPPSPPGGLFAELKRRRVFRVGSVYLVAG